MTHKYSVRYWIGETWFNLRENLPFFALFLPPYHYNIKENVSCLSWNFANNVQYYSRPPTFSKKHNADGGLWNFLQALKLLCHIQSRQVLNIYLGGKYYG